MAEERYDPERIEQREMREDRSRSEWRESKIYDDSEESFNTSTASNLSTDDRFESGRPKSSDLTAQELQHSSMEDWLNKALAADKRSWKGATETGKRKLSARLIEKPRKYDGKLAVLYKANDGKNY